MYKELGAPPTPFTALTLPAEADPELREVGIDACSQIDIVDQYASVEEIAGAVQRLARLSLIARGKL